MQPGAGHQQVGAIGSYAYAVGEVEGAVVPDACFAFRCDLVDHTADLTEATAVGEIEVPLGVEIQVIRHTQGPCGRASRQL